MSQSKTKNDSNDNQRDDEKQSQLDNFLSAIRPGMTVSIWRARPSWCKGYLETMEVDPQSPLDLDYLAGNWGGETLTIRIRDENGRYSKGADIDLASYPPKFQGVPISRNNVDIAYHTGKGAPGNRREDTTERQLQIVNQPPQVQESAGLLKDLVNVLTKMRQSDRDLYAPLLAGPSAAPSNPIEQMIQFARAQKELQELMGWGEQVQQKQSEPNSEMALFGTIAEIVKAMSSNRQPAPVPQYRQAPPRPKIRQDMPQNPQKNQNIVENSQNFLAGLEPDKAADFFVNVVSKMSPQKAEAMFGAIQTRLGMDGDLESEYEEDEIDEEGQEENTDSDTEIG